MERRTFPGWVCLFQVRFPPLWRGLGAVLAHQQPDRKGRGVIIQRQSGGTLRQRQKRKKLPTESRLNSTGNNQDWHTASS